MQIGKQRRERLFHFGIVFAALAIVPLLMAPLVFQQARMRADGEAAVTSVAVLRQLDTLLGVVSGSLDRSQGALGKPCAEVLGRLTRMTMLSPYFRSLVLVERGNVYCSSLQGELKDLPLPMAFKALGSLAPGQRITPSNATPQVPERASVIMSRGDANGSGVLAIIDGQYLLDIQQAASYDGRFQVQMVLRESQRQLPGGTPATQDGGGAIAASARFPVEVRVAVAPALASAYRADAWRHYAPFIVLAAMLAGYLAHLFCRRRLSLVGDMYRAMRAREFHMVYQPIIRLDTGECRGVEALVRWRRPDNSQVRPDIFVPLAEDNGMIGDLTRHIFGLVAADLAQLGLGAGDHLGVNVSGSHLAGQGFVDDVRRLLGAIGSDGPQLVLEVTEREALPRDAQAQRNIRQLRELGVQWALDDFGTGQSSLSYLQQLHADFLKVDRSFVSGVGTESVNAVVLETIIGLAQRLDLDVTAEGIETREQEQYLCGHSVQWGQGYLFSPPLTAAELGAWRNGRRGVARAAQVVAG
ncbi:MULTISPECIES: EAL domain-containing protein [Pseudomonas aeruginosa group]|uniref:cyclic-guanylate-specific phosphodiesterase n=1 Tax=Pseudomonas paraeruginosa TaxID=2994495 RepID=A0A2R3IQZ6_9PSED|nr:MULTISPECIES: EAL domain-containing protein [Pseudomonas aeruginosa group]AVK04057.1 CSS motif domain associated with EAL family protein [Pseudomonas paraeruginosa]AVR67469.1 cyclic diguanylate phosphodiesterase [Pseudomonas paraeruginosa]AWE92753.1 CSS motif domain associated with EAL family protein [Pseudomonas paraeruginosa]KPD29908.1 diguanylate phosphodiesterase [Pseudomonas paraeruginosa]KQB28433.1 diguanylate phosphodiesterase [Pseudomonas paraeruginosa]